MSQLSRIGEYWGIANAAAWLFVVHALIMNAAAGVGVLLFVLEDRAESRRLSCALLASSARLWLNITLLGCIPSAIVLGAVSSRWIGSIHDPALYQLKHLSILWTAAVGVFAGCVAYYAKQSTSRHVRLWLRPFIGGAYVAWTLAASAIYAIVLSPRPWIDNPSLLALWRTPTLGPVVVLHFSHALMLGGITISLPSGRTKGCVWRRAVLAAPVAASSGIAFAVLVSFAVWFAARPLAASFPGLGPRYYDVASAGERWWLVGAIGFASVMLGCHLASRRLLSLRRDQLPWQALMTLAVAGAFAVHALPIVLARPYVMPGYLYSNGVSVEESLAYRRTPFLARRGWSSKQGEEQQTGERMFSTQCAACHSVRSRWARRWACGRDEAWWTRALTEMRDADAIANPYYEVMPPLVGADDEIRALNLWLQTLCNEGEHDHGERR